MITPLFLEALSAHLSRIRLAGRSPATIYQRNGSLTRFARAIPSCPLEVTSDELDEWQTVTLGGLAARSRASDVGHVACFYRWSVGHGLITADRGAMIDARLVRPQLPRRLPRPIAEHGLDQLVFDAPDTIRPWLILAGWAGLRAGEVSRVQRADVRETADPAVIFVHGKGGRERIVPLSPFVLAELASYGLPSRGPVFRRPSDGRQHTPHRVSVLANRYMRSVGVDDTFHALRHRFATQLYAATGDLRLVQEMLGHANLATTTVYVGWSHAAAVSGVAALRVPGADAAA